MAGAKLHDFRKAANEPGRPVVLDAWSEALVAGAWSDVCIEDWTPRFIHWHARLLERIRAHRPDIIVGARLLRPCPRLVPRAASGSGVRPAGWRGRAGTRGKAD
jgi:hypothetical protein